MDTNTTQVEGLDFTVKDNNASTTADHLAKAFDRVHHASEQAIDKVKEFGKHAALGALAGVGMGIGLHELADKAKEVNLELEHTTEKIAGAHFAFQNWKSDIPVIERWSESMAQAGEVEEHLARSEDKLMLARGSMGDVYTRAYALGSRHNLSQEQTVALTEKLAAAQSVLGVSAEGAAMQITRMSLIGNMRGLDPFSVQMRKMITNTKEFHKLSEEKRFEKIQKAMGDLVPAAIAMNSGIEGSLTTIKNKFGDLFRELTKPLFGEQTKSMAEWASKFTEIGKTGKSLAHEYGEKLVTVFNSLKSATAFIADHWKAIALLWGGNKLFGGLNGLTKSMGAMASGEGAAGGAAGVMSIKANIVNVNGQTLASSLGGVAGKGVEAAMKPGLADTMGKLAGMASKVVAVGEGLGLLYVAASAAVKVMEEWHDTSVNNAARWGKGSEMDTRGLKLGDLLRTVQEKSRDMDPTSTASRAAVAASAKAALTQFRATYGSDVIDNKGAVNAERAKEAYWNMSKASRLQQVGNVGLTSDAANYGPGNYDKQAQTFVSALISSLSDLGALIGQAPKGKALTDLGKNTTNIYGGLHITQDFKEADPDRVFHRTINEVNHMAHSPGGALTTQVSE